MTISMNKYLSPLPRIQETRASALAKIRRVFVTILGMDPKPSEKQLEEIQRFIQMGDPLADAVVAMYKEFPPGQGRKLLDQALEQGIESIENPPQALVDLFNQVDHEPVWLDQKKLKLACDVSRRVGLSGELVLRNLSLMGGYISAAAAKPLAFTGQLDRMTPRRLVETSKFWMDVTTVGGLARDQEGFKSAIRVRMMHAQVRAMLVNSEKWNEEWGHPLNQWDSMATILEFSSIFLTGLRMLGFIFTKKEREAVIHLWRYIGFLLGVDERILPANEADSMRAIYHAFATAGKSDEDSRLLGQSLGDSPLQQASDDWLSQQTAKIERIFRIGYSRYMLGDRACDDLGLPRTATKYFWPAQAPIRFVSELVRVSVPGLNKRLVARGEKAMATQFPKQIRETKADTSFTPVKELAR